MQARQSHPPRNLLFIYAIACLLGCWLGSTMSACEPTKPAEQASGQDASTKDAQGNQDQGSQDQGTPIDTTGPQDTGPQDTGSQDGGSQDGGAKDEGQPGDTPKESPPESSGELAPVPDGPVTAGPCQSKAPKCGPGYVCRDDVPPATCHRQCDPSKRGGCPTGHLCQVLSSGEGICVKGTAVAKGAKCDPQKICDFGLVCVLSATGSTEGTCYQRCTLDTLQSCPSNEYCFLVHSRNGVCLPGPAGTKAAGTECRRSSKCQPGMVCFTPTGQKSRCATLCDTKNPCTPPLQCRPLKGAPKDAGACIQ